MEGWSIETCQSEASKPIVGPIVPTTMEDEADRLALAISTLDVRPAADIVRPRRHPPPQPREGPEVVLRGERGREPQSSEGGEPPSEVVSTRRGRSEVLVGLDEKRRLVVDIRRIVMITVEVMIWLAAPIFVFKYFIALMTDP